MMAAEDQLAGQLTSQHICRGASLQVEGSQDV